MSQTVIFEATPNPQAMKFIITDRLISSESANFTNAQDSLRSPLARKLFGFPWASGVFIGSNFVTVTKQAWVDWQVLAEPLANLIEEHVISGETILLPKVAASEASSETTTNNVKSNDSLSASAEDSPVVAQIKQILENEIRPAVAMDGGDISFYKYEDQKVYLEMQGSCSGCPSAAMTLKDGIEARLRQAIPEIQEVVSI